MLKRLFQSSKKENEFTMSVSPICVKDGKKVAYVSFSDGERSAEGIIPDCVITSAVSMNLAQVRMLEEYMRQELPNLKRMAAGIRIIDAL